MALYPAAALVASLLLLPAGDLGGGEGLFAEDLDGDPVRPLAGGGVVVVLFARTDCPISNRFSPELRRIHEEYTPRAVTFWLVYPDLAEAAATIRLHVEEYRLPMTPLRDPEHRLVRRVGATVTPEAAVFQGGELVYRGRVDNRYVAFGRQRAAPTRHDLREALEAVLRGELPAVSETTAIGCDIPPLSLAP